MAKIKSVFKCMNCGYESIKWLGRCPNCEAWNTLTERLPKNSDVDRSERGTPLVQQLYQISYEEKQRVSSGFAELDRVLGGGFVFGSTILMGGEPGAGKSTLLLQIGMNLALQGKKVLYMSGEESDNQVAMRAQRIGSGEIPENILFISRADVEFGTQVCVDQNIDFLFIDSIQTAFLSAIQTSPGSILQVRESAAYLCDFANRSGIVVIIVAHITKEGSIAGPKILEHLVDNVLYFDGERSDNLRMIRSYKNRFGNINEIALYKMEETGLFEVDNLQDFFVKMHYLEKTSGSTIVPTRQGSLMVLIEIQTLVNEIAFQSPRRASEGIDQNKLHLLVAVLDKYSGINLRNHDVFVKMGSGFMQYDTAMDLALLAAIYSSLMQKPLPEKTFFLGEVTLGGMVRPVKNATDRLEIMNQVGWHKGIISAHDKENAANFQGDLLFVESLDQMLRYLHGK